MPKLTVKQAIQKSLILWNMQNMTIKVYYKKRLQNTDKAINIPCLIIDYDNQKREWYIIMFKDTNIIKSCTIDDITGTASVKSFDNFN